MLTPLQESIVLKLAAGKEPGKIAQNLRIPVTDIRHWMAEQEFADALAEERERLLRNAYNSLGLYVTKAIDTLTKLLDSPLSEMQFKAAESIIKHLGRHLENSEMEKRLRRIEKQMTGTRKIKLIPPSEGA